VLWSSFGRLAHTPRALAQNGGGSIDARELKELMVSAGQNPTDEELEEMIRIADADGTGDIDFAEFVTLMAHKMADEKSEETLRAAFSVFDTSGDGFINAEEMRRIMINVGEPVTLEDVEQVIRKVDKNGDGAIDYDEFTKVTPHPTPPSTSLLPPQRVLGAPSCAGVAPVRRHDVADVVVSCGCARHRRSSWTSSFLRRQVSDLCGNDLVARAVCATAAVCAAATGVSGRVLLLTVPMTSRSAKTLVTLLFSSLA
jgi:calmodulin